jgi:nucleoid DNA-binding protein
VHAEKLGAPMPPKARKPGCAPCPPCRRGSARGGPGTGPTKSETVGRIADRTGATKTDINGILAALATVIEEDLRKYGKAAVPGLTNFVVRRRPARAAQMGRNPFTGQEMMMKARPAANIVKARPLKALRDAV